VQATRLLVEREPGEARGQLAQLDELTRGALQEMSALGSDLPASISAQGGLVAALERHCTERKLRDGLVVTLEVDGDEPVPAEDEQSLMRIAQEGLNNVVKHAGVGEAAVRLRLRRPFRLEVEDRGRGFDPEQAGGAGLGLTSMTERAAEMGWSLTVTSTPGSGTRVVAEEAADEGGHDRG
jgi:signal transduction histidine kinase